LLLLYSVIDDSDNGTSTNGNRCSCINQCKVVTYSSTVSAAQLSSDTNLFGAGFKSRISHSFWNALEIAERVDEENMMQTVQQVDYVLEAHKRLQDMINFNVVSDATSLSTQLSMFNNAILRMLETTIKSNRALYHEMNNLYMQYVDPIVSECTSTMKTAEHLYSKVIASFMTSEVLSSETLTSLITELDSTVNKLFGFKEDLNATSAYDNQFFPQRLLNSRECLKIKERLNSTVIERTKWLSGFPSTSKFDKFSDSRKASDMRSLLNRATNCLQSYKSELDQFSNWLDSVRLAQFPNSSLSISHIDVDGNNLRELLRGFINGSQTKKKLMETYLTVIDNRMETNVDRIINTVKQSVFFQLSAGIDNFEKWLKSFFQRLFATYVGLQQYMGSEDKGIEKHARHQIIWRKPIVSFQSINVSNNTCLSKYNGAL